MPRAWLINGLIVASLGGVLALAIAMSPALSPSGDPPAVTTGPHATPPPEWTDAAAVAVGRVTLGGAQAHAFRILEAPDVIVLDQGQYELSEAGVWLDPLANAPTEYAAAIAVAFSDNASKPRLFVFSGLDGLWATSGESTVDTMGRPAPFRLHAGPERMMLNIWATTCKTRNPALGEDAFKDGPSGYGVEPGPSFLVEFVDASAPCHDFEVTLQSFGLLSRTGR